MNNVIQLNNINKYYKLKNEMLHVLKDINLTIQQGEFIMIMGKSGSGKTTLLNLLGFLDRFEGGNYIFNGSDVTNLNESQRSELRNGHMGFIFQQFHLVDSLSIWQNVELPLLYKEKGLSRRERAGRIEKHLGKVGLLDKKDQLPSELSGGQQQRIAIARALINDPDVIFADEPTGALDSETGQDIVNILKKLNKEKKTIVMVTHDEDLTKYASRVIHLKHGAFHFSICNIY